MFDWLFVNVLGLSFTAEFDWQKVDVRNGWGGVWKTINGEKSKDLTARPKFGYSTLPSLPSTLLALLLLLCFEFSCVESGYWCHPGSCAFCFVSIWRYMAGEKSAKKVDLLAAFSSWYSRLGKLKLCWCKTDCNGAYMISEKYWVYGEKLRGVRTLSCLFRFKIHHASNFNIFEKTPPTFKFRCYRLSGYKRSALMN